VGQETAKRSVLACPAFRIMLGGVAPHRDIGGRYRRYFAQSKIEILRSDGGLMDAAALCEIIKGISCMYCGQSAKTLLNHACGIVMKSGSVHNRIGETPNGQQIGSNLSMSGGEDIAFDNP
jgi:hypothetical protein